MNKVFCLLSLIFPLCFLSADHLVSMKASIPRSSTSADCHIKDSTRFIVKHREHNGVGYDTGYTTFAMFLTPGWTKMYAWQPFFDARAHIFNDGRFAANAGAGIRVPVNNDYWPFATIKNNNWVFGTNVFYDYRSVEFYDYQRAEQNFNIHQIAGGLEALSHRVDIRLNGYYPFRGAKTVSNTNFERFTGNGALVRRRRKADIAFPSIQTEAGFSILKAKIINLYFAIGPYYLFNQKIGSEFPVSSGNTWGGKARLSALVYDGISLGIEGTCDGIFHGTFQGYAAFSLPLGPANIRTGGSLWKKRYNFSECDSHAHMALRLTQDVQRNEIIPITKRERVDPDTGLPFLSLTNPDTGLPVRFIFVDNRSGSSGTFESPFATLADAVATSRPMDVIYLSPGDGTTRGYNAGVVLKDGQILSGTGTELQLAGISIPPWTPGRMPVLTNSAPGQDVITLANGNTVQGLSVTSGGGWAISGASIKGVTISENRISGDSGIVLRQTGGNHLVQNNRFNIQGQHPGVHIDAPEENFRGIVRNNNFSNFVATRTITPLVLFSNNPGHTKLNRLSLIENVFSYPTMGITTEQLAVQLSARSSSIFDIRNNNFLYGLGIGSRNDATIFLSLRNNSASEYGFRNESTGGFRIQSASLSAFQASNTSRNGFFYTTKSPGNHPNSHVFEVDGFSYGRVRRGNLPGTYVFEPYPMSGGG